MNSCNNVMKTLHNFVRILSFDFLDDVNILIQNIWVNNWTPLSKTLPSTAPLQNYEAYPVNYVIWNSPKNPFTLSFFFSNPMHVLVFSTYQCVMSIFNIYTTYQYYTCTTNFSLCNPKFLVCTPMHHYFLRISSAAPHDVKI
jgi:hypothetical protein